MLILIENYNTKLPQEKINEYHRKGYRVAYLFDNPKIFYKESVGFILDTLYKRSIDTIGFLINTGHKVSISYKDEKYILNTPEDWKHSYQSDKDMLKMTSIKHPVLIAFEEQYEHYKEQREANKIRERLYTLKSEFQKNPEEQEIDDILRTFAPLYQIDYDYNDTVSRLTAYFQITFYMEHDIEYSGEVPGIAPEDTPFKDFQFQIPNPCFTFDEEFYGDETFLEDMVYKNTKSMV